MRAFIDAEVSKPELLEALAWYREEDRLRQGGSYWQGGRGCAVGCTLHEFATGEEERHVLYEDLFGISQELARLEDAVFEGMHPEAARAWPERFIGSIPEGADLECVADELALWILGGEDSPMAAWRDSEYLQPTLELYRGHLDGLPSRRGDWKEAAGIARDAAGSADSELDTNAAWAATYGHRDEEYWKLAKEAAGLAAGLTVQSRPAGASRASVGFAAERARMEAWESIADKLVEVLANTEVEPTEGDTLPRSE